MTFVQENGSTGTWEQVRWNSSLDNGVGQLTGGYELIIWNDILKEHQVQGRYNYTMFHYLQVYLRLKDIWIHL